MPRPKAATPAAKIREIVHYFETVPIEVAEIAFELARAAVNERKIVSVKRKEKEKSVRLSRSDEARDEMMAGSKEKVS